MEIIILLLVLGVFFCIAEFFGRSKHIGRWWTLILLCCGLIPGIIALLLSPSAKMNPTKGTKAHVIVGWIILIVLGVIGFIPILVNMSNGYYRPGSIAIPIMFSSFGIYLIMLGQSKIENNNPKYYFDGNNTQNPNLIESIQSNKATQPATIVTNTPVMETKNIAQSVNTSEYSKPTTILPLSNSESEIIEWFLSKFDGFNMPFQNIGIIIDKTWCQIQDNQATIKYIFRKNNIVLVENQDGVTTGSWEFINDSRTLFIELNNERKLLQAKHISPDLIIFFNEFSKSYLLWANNLVHTFFDSNKIIKSHIEKNYTALEYQIINSSTFNSIILFTLKKKTRIDEDLTNALFFLTKDDKIITAITDTLALSENFAFLIKENKIQQVYTKTTTIVENNKHYHVWFKRINSDTYYYKQFLIKGVLITLKNEIIEDEFLRLTYLGYTYLLQLSESEVTKRQFIMTYTLKDRKVLEVLQKYYDKVSIGDVVTYEGTTESPVDDKYKLKNWVKINIKDGVVV